jgi:pilus assembly protein CpaB
MRKIIPFVAALVVFLAAVVLIQPAPSTEVVVAARNMIAGHVIQADDVRLQEFPDELVPADAFLGFEQAVGQTLAVGRAAGDVLSQSNMGEPVKLQPNERAVAVRVTDSSGLAGLIKPGDIVGIVATVNVQDPGGTSGSFSKATIEPLRVIYLSPEFESLDVDQEAEIDPITGLSQQETREQEGTVLLAVPTDAQVLVYDFSAQLAPNELVWVNAIELLVALDSSREASLSLYMVPDGAQEFATSGLFLPDLVITPGPTPTPTETPFGRPPETETPITESPTAEGGS